MTGVGRPVTSRWVHAADILALLLIVLTFHAVFFGGITVPIGPFTLRARSSVRLLVQALVVLGIRHYFVPQPSLASRLTAVPDSLVARWPHFMAVLPVWFLSRGLVLVAGYLAVRTFGFTPDGLPSISPNELLNLPMRWDAAWYVEIAASGYDWNPDRQGEQQSLAFFPANPMIMRVAWWLTHDGLRVAWTGAAVAVLSFLVALVLLHRMTSEKLGSEAAAWTVALMATYPFAIFYSVPYTEGLFLLAVVSTVYFFERGAFLRAAALGLGAGLTRPNGWWLSGFLTLLVWERWRAQRRSGEARVPAGAAVAVIAPVVGMLIYSAAVYGMTGDPFTWAWLHGAWGRQFQWIDRTLLLELHFHRQFGTFDWLARRPTEALNLGGTLLALASIWPVTRRLGLAYGGFVAANTIGPLLFGGLISMGRMTSILFPMFMWLAASASPASRRLLLLMFAFAQAWAAALFFTWRPLF